MPRLFIVFCKEQQNILLRSQENFWLSINKFFLAKPHRFVFSFTYSCIPSKKFFPQSVSILSHISILYNYLLFPCSAVMPLYVCLVCWYDLKDALSRLDQADDCTTFSAGHQTWHTESHRSGNNWPNYFHQQNNHICDPTLQLPTLLVTWQHRSAEIRLISTT